MNYYIVKTVSKDNVYIKDLNVVVYWNDHDGAKIERRKFDKSRDAQIALQKNQIYITRTEGDYSEKPDKNVIETEADLDKLTPYENMLVYIRNFNSTDTPATAMYINGEWKLTSGGGGGGGYIHPSKHPATMITEDATHRFVTDTQISDWNTKVDKKDLEKVAFSGDYNDLKNKPTSTGGSAALTKDIVANNTVGNTPAGFVFKKGMTFDEYVQAVHVAYIKPKITSFTPASATYEIGTQINSINVQATVQKQSYDITSVELYLNNTLLKLDNSVASGGTVSVTANPNTNDTNFTISCDVKDGTSTVNARNSFNFVRYGFYGHDASSTACSTSADVRGLTSNVANPKSGTKFTVAAKAGDQRITIAVPAPLTIASAKYQEGMNAESKSIFTQTTVNVEGKNGYTAVAYNVFTYVPLTAFSGNYTLDVTLG